MKFDLKDKVVVITGGSSGIGKALVAVALKKGAFVATCARTIEKLQAINFTNSNRLFLFQADVSQEHECELFMDKTIEKWGRIDVLINNAGISMRALFADTELSVIKALMDVNFWGAVNCTKFALPNLIKNSGIIVGISSIAGYRGLPARTGYSASKFALQGFLESLKTELLHTGVHVMWVAPGFTASNIRNTALNSEGNSQQETPLSENQLMTAEACAQSIFSAIENKKRTVVMTLQGKLTVFLNKFLPKLTDKLVFNHFAKEPNSPLTK